MLATAATVASLFAPWYGHGFVVSTEGGYVIRSVPTRSGDAWTVVPGTAWMILAACVVTLTGLASQPLKRSRIAARLTVPGCVAAVSVTVWRAADPVAPGIRHPTQPRVFSMPDLGGGTAALAAACVALVAAAFWLLSSERGEKNLTRGELSPGRRGASGRSR